MGNIVKFAKPYSFEGTEYTEVDLSGMDKLTIQDMIDIQKSLANELASLAALEATTSFAQEMATKASGKPVEFFKLMPRAKIKQVQTAMYLRCLNAPFGARCFLTARRVAPPVTRENVVPDRQWSKKHPSGQQARGQSTRLFVATARIAAERLWGRRCPGNRRHRRRVAPP